MRIVSYNILDGGEGREEALVEVITAERPDVVCIVEADSIGVVERIARASGMDFIHAEGQGHAAAILSRWAIVDSVNHAALDGLPRSLVEATIEAPAGLPRVIGAVHFRGRATEQRESEREVELARLLEVFGPHRRAGRAHVLAGDFNANSPVQQIDPERLAPASRAAWEAQGGQVPRKVVRRLLDAGYVDSLEAVHPDSAPRLASFTTEHPGQRLDYIFTFGVDRARMRGAWVTQNDVAKEASDHFPVGLEIT